MANTSKSSTKKKTNPKKPKVAQPGVSQVAASKKIATSKKTKVATLKSVKKPEEAKPVSKHSKPARTPRKLIVGGLRTWNIAAAALHTLMGVLVVVLSSPDKGVQIVTTNYLTIDQLQSNGGAPVLTQATRTLFDVNLAYLVAVFFFLSAAAHLIIATIYRKRYEANLERGINKARWYEYALSASVMMVAIGFLSGITDLSTLVMIFALDAIMNLMGLVMEEWNQKTEKTNWISYWIGCLAGIVPWVVFGIYVWGASVYGDGGVPGFVYGIYASIFIFFNCFALNMWLQYKKKGPWANYLYGERVYIILSLVAKTALAWQVFAGVLRP